MADSPPNPQLASEEDIQKALDQWIKIQSESPSSIKKYTDLYDNPFVPWPPTKEKIVAFLQYYPPEGVGPNTIEITLRDTLIKEFEEGSKKAKAGSITIESNTKKHVVALKEAAKKAGKPLLDITPPAATTETTEPLPEKLFQDVVKETLEAPIKPEKKVEFFQTLTTQATLDQAHNKTVEIPKLTEKVIAIVALEDELFIKKDSSQTFSFKDIARTSLQKSAAPILDWANMVFPGARDAALDKIVGTSLQKTQKAMDSLGQSIVAQPWFAAAQRDIGRLIGEKNARSGVSGITGIVSDISSSIFRGAPDESVVAYFELWHMRVMHSLSTPSFSQFRAATMNAKSWAIQFGKEQVTEGFLQFLGKSLGLGAKTAGGIAGKGLATAAVETGAGASGPWGWAALAGAWLLGKAKDGFTKIMSMVTGGEVPGDRAILFILIGVVFVFFVPIFPLLSFVGLNQLNIDTALITNMSLTGGGSLSENPYLDMTITATPTTLIGNRPTAIRYDVCVKPKGPTDSFKINSAQIKFFVYGFQGNSGLNAPDINPTSFTNGCFSFTVPVGPQLENTVITASFTVNADVGANVGVSGFSSASTIIGNPTNDILIPGPSGYQPGGWCNKDGASVPWSQSDWGTMLGAIATLSKYPNYLSLVRQYNPAGITVYRINWTGNYWGCTSADTTSIMFIYNGGIPNATYILTHELGHRISASPWFSLFKSEGIINEGTTAYAGGYSDLETRLSEDFAETFALYVTNPNGLKASLPKHYDFAKRVMEGGNP